MKEMRIALCLSSCALVLYIVHRGTSYKEQAIEQTRENYYLVPYSEQQQNQDAKTWKKRTHSLILLPSHYNTPLTHISRKEEKT